SSRRRHTRSYGDWSSDVCSSDLTISTGASTNVVEIYDIASNTWSAGAVYPITESFISAWTQGGFIYTAGGIDGVTAVESNKTYRSEERRVGKECRSREMTCHEKK